jgi:hypothetical protein
VSAYRRYAAQCARTAESRGPLAAIDPAIVRTYMTILRLTADLLSVIDRHYIQCIY